MKKIFFLASIFTLAFTAAMFTSCSKDNDPVNDVDPTPTPTPQEEPYKAVQFWASDELLEIADVVCSGVISNYTFTESMTPNWAYGKGKAGAAFEVTNINPDDEVIIAFKLKSNWEEILGDRETITLASARTYTTTKKGDPFLYPTNSKSNNYNGRADINIKGIASSASLQGGLKAGLEACLDMSSIYLTGKDF